MSVRCCRGRRKIEECSSEHVEFEIANMYAGVDVSRQLGVQV